MNNNKLRYCGNENDPIYEIYDMENNEIGRGLKQKNMFKIFRFGNLEECAYAHICHINEFKCNNENCKHFDSGEILLVRFINQFSLKRLFLISLNEPIIELDYTDLRDNCLKNEELLRYLFISCNKQWSEDKWYLHTLLFCDLCRKSITINQSN